MVFFAVLRCFLFKCFAVCMWGRGGGEGREGLPAQPSPTPGEGLITHEYRVTSTTIYTHVLYKETGPQKAKAKGGVR